MVQVVLDRKARWLLNSGGQAAFFNDWQHKFVALEGGWGSGKTWAGARKLVALHVKNALAPLYDDHGNPVLDENGGHLHRKTCIAQAAIAPTYGDARTYMVPAIKSALEEAGLEHEWKIADSDFVIHALGTRHHPSLIYVRTAEAPERITGWEVGGAWGDEPTRWKESRHDPKLDPYVQLLGRVRAPGAQFLQLMFTYTNEGDSTRIYEAFHAGREDHALYRAPTRENPVMREWCTTQAELLTEDLRRQYLMGEAISLRGASVYSMFDSARHVDNTLELSPHLEPHLSLDFNIAPGMHGILGQYNPNIDLFTAVYELHRPRMSVRDLVDDLALLIGRLGGWHWPVLHVFGDASGHAATITTGESCYNTLCQGLDEKHIPYRLHVPLSNPPIVDRVNAFNGALLDFQGRIHWCCHKRCERLIDDLKRMRYDERGQIEEFDRKLSHASSAEGYRISSLRPVRIRLPEQYLGGRVNV